MTGALDGIKVIDMTRVLAGPYCTMLLADLGAEVIKIERPQHGDDSRAFGPYQNGESAYFMSINRGKKSLTLNIKTEKGKDILRRLVSQADVLVENFRPGVMAKLGLDYENLKKVNPRLIYCASSGFGQTGPYSKRAAYDLVIQGMGGIMSITGPDSDNPTKVGSSIADIFAGVFSTIGILAAIYRRHTTNLGQMVDVAMLDCMVAILENAIARYTTTKIDPKPIGNRHPSIAPFTSVRTSDGFINIACGNDILWKEFCKIINRTELPDDERFLTNENRCQNMDSLIPIIESVIGTNTSAHWLDLFEKGSIPAGPINSISELLKDPQVLSREMLVDLIHPIAGETKVPGVPIKFSTNAAKIKTPAPTLGQHNTEILTELGYSQNEIDNMKNSSVI